MQTKLSVLLVFALEIAGVEREAQARGPHGGFAGGFGSVQYAGYGDYDQAWNAGFNGGPSPGALTANKQIATVNSGSIYPQRGSAQIDNRIDGQVVSSPLNYGSIVSGDAASAASLSQYMATPGGVLPPDEGPAGTPAFRRPYAGRVRSTLPEGYTAAEWRGVTYYHDGSFRFYRPYWYAGKVSYWPVPPPLGWFFPVLPETAAQQIVDNQAYFSVGDIFFVSGIQGGENGFVVVDAPAAQSNSSAGGSPDPVQLIHAMSDYLGNCPQLTLTTRDTFEEQTASGAKIHVSTKQTAAMERPDKMAIVVIGDGRNGRILYDNKTVTALDVVSNVYGTIPATGPLSSVLDMLTMDYSIAVPGDLLYPDLYRRVARKIQSSHYVASESVGGNLCHHLLFAMRGVDWQLWIQDGDTPIPRRMVMTYTTTPGLPQYTQEVTGFNTGPIPASTFKLELPAGAHKIDFLPTRATKTSER